MFLGLIVLMDLSCKLIIKVHQNNTPPQNKYFLNPIADEYC